jgi:hypothetical protein
MEAWRRAGYTPFNESVIVAIASALGLRTPAVMIAPRLASEYGVFSSLPSSLPSPSSSLSQPTPRTTASHAASARKKTAALLALRSTAAAASFLSTSSAIDAALRAHHRRRITTVRFSKTRMLQGNTILRCRRYQISLLME